MNQNLYESWLKHFGIEDAREKAGLLEIFKRELLKENKTRNLTSVRDGQKFDYIHILDSLTAAALIKFKERDGWEGSANETPVNILDLGTGGGLPGIPLAVVLGDYHFTLIDSVKKKIDSLARILGHLRLDNISCVAGRIEDWRNNPGYHKKFDLVISRAFGKMDFIIDLTYPLLKEQGFYLLFRGEEDKNTRQILESYLNKSSGKIIDIYRSGFTEELGKRSIYKIDPGKERFFSKRSFQSIKKASLRRHKPVNIKKN